jgi:hypothetical protein
MALDNGNGFFKKAPEVCRWGLHCTQGSDGNIEDSGLISLTRNIIYIYIIYKQFILPHSFHKVEN